MTGLELNRALAAHVTREYELPVFQGLIDDPRFESARFDVIVSSRVFEHLLDPRDTLRKVTAHLRLWGALLIEVPNLRHIKERLRRMPPDGVHSTMERVLAAMQVRTALSVIGRVATPSS